MSRSGTTVAQEPGPGTGPPGVPRRLEGSFRVRFDEAGPDGLLRASGYVRYLQDLAWQHSEAAGFDRAWYAARGVGWLVRGVDLSLEGGVAYGETLQLSTEVVGWRHFWARRHSAAWRVGDPALLADALIDWVLLDVRGRPTRLPREIEALVASGAAYAPSHLDLPPTPPGTMLHRSRVRPWDLDPLGHVNNAVYLDYLEETLAAVTDAAVGASPRRFRLEYLHPALPGAELIGAAWELDGGWAYRLVDGSGAELIQARLEVGAGRSGA